MKLFFILIFNFITITSFCQKVDDTKIIVIVNDSNNLYNKVKYALVEHNFIVKDNGNKDTLTTYSSENKGIHCIMQAIITENKVTFSGVFGLKRIDDFGYTQNPKKYSRVMYYKGSKTWKLLNSIAKKLNGEISYSR